MTELQACGRALIIEDDEDTAASLKEMLLLDGVAEVGSSRSVRDAQATIRGGFWPCVVVLDLVLGPEDGEDFLTWLEEAPERGVVRVVALSGFQPSLDHLTGRVAGQLLKPSDPSHLLAAVSDAWRSISSVVAPTPAGSPDAPSSGLRRAARPTRE